MKYIIIISIFIIVFILSFIFGYENSAYLIGLIENEDINKVENYEKMKIINDRQRLLETKNKIKTVDELKAIKDNNDTKINNDVNNELNKNLELVEEKSLETVNDKDINTNQDTLKKEDYNEKVKQKEYTNNDILDKLKADVEKTFKELIISESINYIKEIQYTEHFKEVNIKVNRRDFEGTSNKGIAPLLIAITVSTYQDTASIDLNIKVNFIDALTNEIIEVYEY